MAVGLGSTTPSGVEIHVVADELLVTAVSHGHTLDGRRTITLSGLRDLPLISLPRGTGLRSRVDDACAAAGFPPRVAFEASDPRVLVQLAARGLGVAVLPASLAAAHRTELHAVRITHPRLRGRIALAWRAEGPIGPAGRALIGHARTALRTPIRAD
ncbi:LysR substrate-binding domain-containing protein [Streptantibioticus ferralitis]|uniref:LysR substrate-binding domain-containing protein n=1 Tax=Streptantibioticus ferralitis TaxID=236510 RepID=A0ABT5YTC5_9ACTN|nr:LysR substrate-binding domain-containing protein [Streptantibioticus ferralitis]MDF2254861.1 LysR substrate-binding domain-containing protein [Streptantibioticus ferralitis]